MDAKYLLLAHGEKAAVLVVGLVSAWIVTSSFTDSSIRPNGVTQQSVSDHIADINRVMNSSDVPTMVPAPPYRQQMVNRFSQDITPSPRISWMMNHSDIGGGPSGIYFYVYEIFQPSVTATDDIGNLEIVVSPPPVETGDERLSSDQPTKEWPRQTEHGTVVNRGGVAGVQIQIKVGQGEWANLVARGVGDGGFIPLADLGRSGKKIKMPALVTWQEHSFRVRSVVHATGFTGESADSDETVLVHQGTIDEPKDWADYAHAFESDPTTFLGGFETGVKDTIPGMTLPDNELVYYSPWSDPFGVMATASVRFAFEKPIENFGAAAPGAAGGAPPAPTAGRFAFSKQFATPSGNAWLAHTVEFKANVGDKLGGMMNVATPTSGGIETPQAFDTSFQVTGFLPGQVRVLYYTIRLVTDQTTHLKSLEIAKKSVTTTVAVLTNTHNQEEVKLPQLMKILRPNGVKTIYWPLISGDSYDEPNEFKNNPAGFQQRELIPPMPKTHPANTPGPLADLHNRTDAEVAQISQLAITNTDYVIMPDGRLVWYFDVGNTHTVMQWPLPAADTTAPPAGTTKPAATPARPTQPNRPVQAQPYHDNRPANVGPNGPPMNQGGAPGGAPGGGPPQGPPPGMGAPPGQ